jgi:hypothetical protein
MSDIHALSGAYAVDALDDIERARFVRHLEECPECQAEVAGLREAAALLSLTTTVQPPADLRARVLRDITSVRPLPPLDAAADPAPDAVADPAPHPGARPTERRRWRGLVAAAAAVVLVGAGGTIAVQSLSDDRDDRAQVAQPTEADRVRAAADAVTQTQRLPNGGEATVVASRKLNKVVVMTKDLPPLDRDKIYEMWIQDAQKGMVKAGTMTAADATVVLDGDLRHAVGAGITVEPAGGSNVPTTEPIALFSFENA